MKRLLPLPIALVAALAGGAAQSVCGPFTDVPPALCPFVAELYYTGITAGSSPTKFSPDTAATRGPRCGLRRQGAGSGSEARSSRRAALGQWWITKGQNSFGLTSIGGSPQQCRSDGADLWVTNLDGWVSRVRASDGRLLETWTGATAAAGVLVAMGRFFITGEVDPGALYMIDPAQPAGSVSTAASDLGGNSRGIAFDGSRIWTANATGSVSIVTPGPTLPWPVTTITEGFTAPTGILFDGTNVWVTDSTAQALLKLDPNGSVLNFWISLIGPGQVARF